MRRESNPIVLEEGKSYTNIRTQKTSNYRASKKIHVDKIIKNPYYQPHDDWIENAEDLIVYRIWNRRHRRFDWHVESFWNICIWNDWKYQK